MAPGRSIIAVVRAICQRQRQLSRLDFSEGSARPHQSEHSRSSGFGSQYLRSWSSDVAVNEAVLTSTEPDQESANPSSEGIGTLTWTRVYTTDVSKWSAHVTSLVPFHSMYLKTEWRECSPPRSSIFQIMVCLRSYSVTYAAVTWLTAVLVACGTQGIAWLCRASWLRSIW